MGLLPGQDDLARTKLIKPETSLPLRNADEFIISSDRRTLVIQITIDDYNPGNPFKAQADLQAKGYYLQQSHPSDSEMLITSIRVTQSSTDGRIGVATITYTAEPTTGTAPPPDFELPPPSTDITYQPERIDIRRHPRWDIPNPEWTIPAPFLDPGSQSMAQLWDEDKEAFDYARLEAAGALALNGVTEYQVAAKIVTERTYSKEPTLGIEVINSTTYSPEGQGGNWIVMGGSVDEVSTPFTYYIKTIVSRQSFQQLPKWIYSDISNGDPEAPDIFVD